MSTFSDVLQARFSRRRLLTSGLFAAGLGWLGPASWAGGPLGFTGVPVSTADTLVVPPGYLAEILYAWGDPISDGPAFKPDASNSVDDQLRQAGMHHDGMHLFPRPPGQTGSTHGLLAINPEYTDDGLLHPDGMVTWTAEKFRAGLDDGIAARLVKQAELVVGKRRGLLDAGQRLDQLGVDRYRRAGDRKILDGTQGVHAVIGIGGDFSVTQKVMFGSKRSSGH